MRIIAALLIVLFALPAHALDIQEIKSPRGITLWFVRDATTPTITVSFAFRGGTESDPANKQGRAYLMANALTEGSDGISADAFAQLLADKNISLGFSAGREAITGNLRYLQRYEETAIDLAREALYEPAFTPDDVNRLKAQMQAGLRQQEADPGFRAARLMMQQTFAGSKYANAARGTPTTIRNLTPDDLRSLHRTALNCANLLVVVVGDTDSKGAARITDTLFAALPQGKTVTVQKTVRQNAGSTWYSPFNGSEQNSLTLTAPAVALTDPDYPAAAVLSDLVSAGGFRAMLMERLRKGLGATYGISAGMQNMDAIDFTMGSTSTQPDMTDATLQLIRDSWGEARSVPFDDDAIAVSKNYLQSSFTRDLTSSRAIAAYILGLRLAHLPRDYADTLPRALEAVTRDDLARVAARLYDPAQLSFVIVGPRAPSAKDRTITDIWSVQ